MQYNIYFEGTGVVVLLIIMYFLRLKYSNVTVSITEFKRLVVYMTLAQSLDIISAETIARSELIPVRVNVAVNTIYLISTALFLYQLAIYVFSYFSSRNAITKMHIICQYVCLVYLAILALNIPTGLLFYFSESGNYIKGPFYVLEFLIPMYFMVYSMIAMLYHKNSFTSAQIHSMVMFSFLAASLSAVQFFFAPKTLLSFFGADLGILIAMFSLETPDYHKLVSTMKELQETKEAAEAAKLELEKANQVKLEFLSKMSHEIRTPINAMMGYSDLINQETEDKRIGEYARKSIMAGNQLIALVDNILMFTDDNDEYNRIHSYIDFEDEKIKISAPNVRILIVDDNPINLDLFTGLLRNCKMKIDTAIDGRESLEKVRKNYYNLIFMDHMMPGMDGVEAFKHMVEENLVPDTPVIVLTANAIPKARDYYLEIGFDEYMTKPVSQQQLFRAIVDFVPEKYVRVESFNGDEIEEASDENKKLIESIDYLDTETGLKYCADSYDFYVEILLSYIEHNRYNQLVSLFAKEDWPEYRIAVHALKSTSFSIGAFKVSDHMKSLEKAVSEENYEKLKKQHETYLEEYGKLITNLRETFDND